MTTSQTAAARPSALPADLTVDEAATVTTQGLTARATRRTKSGDFYLAKTGDSDLATIGDFFMATDRWGHAQILREESEDPSDVVW